MEEGNAHKASDVVMSILAVVAMLIAFILVLNGCIGCASNHSGSNEDEMDYTNGAMDALSAAQSFRGLMKDEDQLIVEAGYGSFEIDSVHLPDWLTDEVLGAELADRIWLNEDSSVVGYLARDSLIGALGKLSRVLEERGWTRYETDDECVATYKKEEGEARWIQASGMETGDETSLVLHILRA